MQQKTTTRKSIHCRVQNISLSEKQFREMIDNHILRSCSGLFCDMSHDYPADESLFWVSSSYDLGTWPIQESLMFFADRYLRTLPDYNGCVGQYVKVIPIICEYTPD